ncbi:hypothetical protein [Nocardia sp. NPDC052566]|uniref:hypothetical protein n=1 Tax=Nocardia sp. NPDC052566 TaxID=3364330 RepID=UPI0037C54369
MLTGVAVLVLTACSSVLTDYRAEADKLEQEISAMPGVQHVKVSIADDFVRGDSYFRLTADLPGATEPQIRDVVTRIAGRTGTFGGLREREFGFVVGDRAKVGAVKELDADALLDAVRNVRQYTASMPDGRIVWGVRPTPKISVMDVKTSTAEPLTAIRTMIGARTAAEVSIETTRFERWSVDLPLSAEREAEFRRQLPETPWAADFVVIKNSHIIQLSVKNTEPAPFDADLTYDQLADAVRKLGPTTDYPLRLDWTGFFYYSDGKRNIGSVHAAGCDYSLATVSDDTLSGPALTVQRRMRAEFGGCR